MAPFTYFKKYQHYTCLDYQWHTKYKSLLLFQCTICQCQRTLLLTSSRMTLFTIHLITILKVFNMSALQHEDYTRGQRPRRPTSVVTLDNNSGESLAQPSSKSTTDCTIHQPSPLIRNCSLNAYIHLLSCPVSFTCYSQILHLFYWAFARKRAQKLH